MERLITRLAQRYLRVFLKGFESPQLSLGLIKGETRLKDLDMNEEALNELIGFPFLEIISAKISELYVKMSVKRIKKEAITVYIDEIDVVATERMHPMTITSKYKAKLGIPEPLLEEMETDAAVDVVDGDGGKKESKRRKMILKRRKQKEEQERKKLKKSSKPYGFLDKIVDGLRVEIKRVNISLQLQGHQKTLDIGPWSPPSCNITLKNIVFCQTDNHWRDQPDLRKARIPYKTLPFINVFKRIALHLDVQLANSMLLSDVELTAQLTLRRYKPDNHIEDVDVQALIPKMSMVTSVEQLVDLIKLIMGIDALARRMDWPAGIVPKSTMQKSKSAVTKEMSRMQKVTRRMLPFIGRRKKDQSPSARARRMSAYHSDDEQTSPTLEAAVTDAIDTPISECRVSMDELMLKSHDSIVVEEEDVGTHIGVWATVGVISLALLDGIDGWDVILHESKISIPSAPTDPSKPLNLHIDVDKLSITHDQDNTVLEHVGKFASIVIGVTSPSKWRVSENGKTVFDPQIGPTISVQARVAPISMTIVPSVTCSLASMYMEALNHVMMAVHDGKAYTPILMRPAENLVMDAMLESINIQLCGHRDSLKVSIPDGTIISTVDQDDPIINDVILVPISAFSSNVSSTSCVGNNPTLLKLLVPGISLQQSSKQVLTVATIQTFIGMDIAGQMTAPPLTFGVLIPNVSMDLGVDDVINFFNFFEPHVNEMLRCVMKHRDALKNVSLVLPTHAETSSITNALFSLQFDTLHAHVLDYDFKMDTARLCGEIWDKRYRIWPRIGQLSLGTSTTSPSIATMTDTVTGVLTGVLPGSASLTLYVNGPVIFVSPSDVDPIVNACNRVLSECDTSAVLRLATEISSLSPVPPPISMSLDDILSSVHSFLSHNGWKNCNCSVSLANTLLNILHGTSAVSASIPQINAMSRVNIDETTCKSTVSCDGVSVKARTGDCEHELIQPVHIDACVTLERSVGDIWDIDTSSNVHTITALLPPPAFRLLIEIFGAFKDHISAFDGLCLESGKNKIDAVVENAHESLSDLHAWILEKEDDNFSELLDKVSDVQAALSRLVNSGSPFPSSSSGDMEEETQPRGPVRPEFLTVLQ